MLNYTFILGGTYDIRYDDGDTEKYIPYKIIRPGSNLFIYFYIKIRYINILYTNVQIYMHI